MEDAVTPLPMPERTPPVTTTIFLSEFNVSFTRVSSAGGRLRRARERDAMAGGVGMIGVAVLWTLCFLMVWNDLTETANKMMDEQNAKNDSFVVTLLRRRCRRQPG